MAVVACENLVPTVAGKAHGHLLPREARHQPGGQKRGVGEGLARHVRKFFGQLQGLRRVEDQGGVARAQVVRHGLGWRDSS
jgi:hypothetical protein